MAGPSKPAAADRYEKRPAKVPGDRDEAKALREDTDVNVTGGPEADLHHPAAADSAADAEAGRNREPAGRIEPLQAERPPVRKRR